MGGKCPHRKVNKRRFSHKQDRRSKFLSKGDDVVYDWLQKEEEGNKLDEEQKSLPRDEDLPGIGQYYCIHYDHYFPNEKVRAGHFKTKHHKKRVKLMMGHAPHTQLDADLAVGMGMPDNGLKLMSI